MTFKSFTYPPKINVIISCAWEIRFWNCYLPTFWLDVIKYRVFLTASLFWICFLYWKLEVTISCHLFACYRWLTMTMLMTPSWAASASKFATNLWILLTFDFYWVLWSNKGFIKWSQSKACGFLLQLTIAVNHPAWMVQNKYIYTNLKINGKW